MVVFVSLAVLLAVAAVLMLVPSILREPDSLPSGRDEKNVDVARDRLSELENSEQAGEVEQALADQIRSEIETALLVDVDDSVDTSETTSPDSRNAKLWIAGAVSFLVPVFAVAMYLFVGSPSLVTTTPIAEVADSMVASSGLEIDGEERSFEELTQRLLSHLSNNPEDAVGWRTLAQLFVAQFRFREAVGAYQKVRELEGDSADVLIRQADAIAMANNGNLEGEPATLIEMALDLDPNHTSGLWLAGLAAGTRGDVVVAIDYWRRAEKTTNDEQTLTELKRLIDSASDELERVQNMDTDVAVGQSSAAIRVSATIAPSVLEKLSADDTVYILARAYQGPPMPLAVLKKQVKDLPFTVSLDDSMAMLPNLTISNYDEVVVVARVALSGTPQAQRGDYFGESETIRPSETNDVVAVEISNIVP